MTGVRQPLARVSWLAGLRWLHGFLKRRGEPCRLLGKPKCGCAGPHSLWYFWFLGYCFPLWVSLLRVVPTSAPSITNWGSSGSGVGLKAPRVKGECQGAPPPPGTPGHPHMDQWYLCIGQMFLVPWQVCSQSWCWGDWERTRQES